MSRSTFKRMIQKAVSLGIFTVHETERKNGAQSSNLYVFIRYPKMNSTHHEPPKKEILNHPKETSNPFKTKQDIKERNDAPLDFTFTSDRVPVSFVDAVKSFFPEAKIIEEYWKMATIAASKNNRDGECRDMIELSIKAFKQMVKELTMLLLYLTSWKENELPEEMRRSWKGYPFDALNELTDEDFISGRNCDQWL